MDWTTVFSSTGAVVVLAYLAKTLAKLLMDRDLRRYQLQLDKDVGAFKAQLERANLEHEIRFKRVDEKVADILSEIYSLLWQLDDLLVKYVNPAAGTDEHYESFETSRRKFEEVFFPKRLYVPPKLFKKANELYKEIVRIATDFTKQRRGVHTTPEDEQDIHFWTKAVQDVNVKSAPLLEQIAAEFQKHLGVEDRSQEA